jgi:hypothetical protein
MRNAERRHPALDLPRFIGGGVAKAVVDRQGVDRCAIGARPLREQDGERQAVGTAGDGDGEARIGTHRHVRHGGGEFAREIVRKAAVVRVYLHFSLARSAAAGFETSSGAFG